MIQRMVTRRNLILAGLAAVVLIIGVLMFAAASDDVTDPAVVDLETDAQPGVLPSGDSEALGSPARYVVS
ncbi:MAG: hypothetical protein PF636_09730, partial [Actinomycetota bacterium]|nr:hypothetical protein [Actinomycetota bacterium]